MEMTSFNFWRQAAYLFVVSSLIVASGCTKSTLRELPFLRPADKTEDAIEQSLASPDSIPLTIWHDSFETALQASRDTGKPILADFTGSDWCTWCIKLKKDVFETSEFKEWARENVILLELDYPKRAMQSAAIRKQNKELSDRYNVSSYPTVLFLDSEGGVLGKLGHMREPSDWIAAAMPMLVEQNRLSEFK